MARRIDPPNPIHHSPSGGRCFVYVVPGVVEDLLKLGFSRDPLERLHALYPRYFDVFDLDRGFLVETETVRDARDLELALARPIKLHSAPAPLTVRRAAAGHTEWYRGAYAQLSDAAQALQAAGYLLHQPLRPWLRRALLARRDLLFTWSLAMLDVDELEYAEVATPAQRMVRDTLDAYVAMEIELESVLPDAVWHWHGLVSGR